MCRLKTEIRPEKFFVRPFRRCASVIECTYTNLGYMVHCASVIECTYTNLGYMVQPIAPRLQTCTAYYGTEYCRQL